MKDKPWVKNPVLPTWVRLTEKGQELIHTEWKSANGNKPSDAYIEFVVNVIDYREGCNRNYGFYGIKSIPCWVRMAVVRFLLYLVEKVNPYKRY